MTDLEMVQQCGYDLNYVEEQTPEICLAAVQQNVWALEFVNEQILFRWVRNIL